MWLPFTRPPVGTWPTTQACALTGNRTHDPLVRRLVLNPLSHTRFLIFIILIFPLPPISMENLHLSFKIHLRFYFLGKTSLASHITNGSSVLFCKIWKTS